MYTSTLLKALSCLALASIVYANAQSERLLLPARKRSSILARSTEVKIHLNDQVELSYAQGSNANHERTYGATVTLVPRQPLLVLEEVEHLFSNIICSDDSITLSMPSKYDTAIAWDTLGDVVDGHVITSHASCNSDWERNVYRITGMEPTTNSSLILLIAPTTFKSAFHPINVELGYTRITHELRSESLVRRDTQSYALALNGLAAINQPIWSASDNIPVEISCRNCTLYGEIDIEIANFSWDCGSLSSVTDNIESPSDCISGRATALAKGLGAEVDLEVSLADSWSQEIPLLPPNTLPQLNISIPGIGAAALTYGPALQVGYELKGSIEMSCGFNMKLLDDAKVWVDVRHLNSSGAQGFDRTSVNVVPFQSKAKIQSLTVSAALRSGIAVSFTFDDVPDVSGIGLAQVYIDTPVITATATPLKDVGADCKPLPNEGTSKTKMSDILENVIHITVTKAWDFGYSLGAMVSALDYTGNLGRPVSGNMTTKPSYLTEMCLNFDPKTGSYESAQQAVSKAEAHQNVGTVNVNSMLALTYALIVFTALFAML